MTGSFVKVLLALSRIPLSAPLPNVPVATEADAIDVPDTSLADADSCITEIEVDPIIPTTATLLNVEVAVATGVTVTHEADTIADTSTANEDNPSIVQRFEKIVKFATPVGTFEDVSNLVLNDNNIYCK